MANPLGPGGFGFLGYVQFARDAAWGTFPTIDHRVPFISANARAVAGRIRPPVLDGSINREPLVAGMQMAEFDLKLPLTYSGQLLIVDAFMGTGTYGSNGGGTTGSNPYTHAWVTQALMNSLSFEIVQGGVTSSTTCVRVTSGKIVRAAIKCTGGVEIEDQLATLDLKIIGKAYTENQTRTGSLTSLTQDYVLAQHMTINTDPGYSTTAATTEELEIVFETMAKERPFLEGSGYISEPQRNGKPKLTITMTKQFQNRTGLSAFMANTHGAGQINFTSGSLQWQLDYYGAYPSFPENPIEDEGWIKQKVVVEDAPGTQTIHGVTIINAQSSITA